MDEWLGHCEEVAKKHYLMVTDDHFAKAVEPTLEPEPKAPVRSGPELPRMTPQPDLGGFPKSLPCKEKRLHAETCSCQIWTILDSKYSQKHGEN